MLQISETQMHDLERGRLAVIKNEILSSLQARYPEQVAASNRAEIEEFVRKSMEATQTIWIDEVPQIRRFVHALFVLEYVMQDRTKLKYFAQVMASEEEAEARIRFVEKNLLPDEDSSSSQ